MPHVILTELVDDSPPAGHTRLRTKFCRLLMFIINLSRLSSILRKNTAVNWPEPSQRYTSSTRPDPFYPSWTIDHYETTLIPLRYRLLVKHVTARTRSRITSIPYSYNSDTLHCNYFRMYLNLLPDFYS
jgi:hypothetical protein